MSLPKRYCAVYTRKSTEDRLDMEFNSLDAQREACLAYIASQKSEGWLPLDKQYDDGGFSGGTMQRPALSELLADIAVGKVHIVVVYKIDRLTRSLMDFAKLVQAFDERGVTFVSVTQSFNTTTSMGRLTLNVLLSFAQFEREVAGERIRDKIAASKRKGMWMGGNPPLGYDVGDRRLIVNQKEANTVRQIYETYLTLGSVRLLKEKLDRQRIFSKSRCDRNGKRTGGVPMSRGALHSLLSNPIYVGRIRHRSVSYEGQHEAIISLDLWEAVQAKLTSLSGIERGTKLSHDQNLLQGLIFDETSTSYSPTFTGKDARRYRYYVNRKANAHRLPAHTLEKAIEAGLRYHLSDLYRASALFGLEVDQHHVLLSDIVHKQAKSTFEDLVTHGVSRIVVRTGELLIELKLAELAKSIADDVLASIPAVGEIVLPFSTQRAARGAIVIQPETPKADALDMPPEQLKKLVQGLVWRDQHFTGATLRDIAKDEGVSESFVGKAIFATFNA